MDRFKLWILAAVLASFASACTDEASSARALRGMGLHDVEWTGYEWAACSDDDTFHTGFRAKNVQGETVEGVVCCGMLWKDCTVRFE